MSNNSVRNLSQLTITLLESLGVSQPTLKQIVWFESLLSNVFLEHRLLFDNQLTDREISCLVLAAKGMTSHESAELLGIKRSTVETYRREIKRKLASNSMAQAVFEGIRFGYIHTVLSANKT